MRLTLHIVVVLFLFSTSCSQFIQSKKERDYPTKELTQKAIFEYLRQPTVLLAESFGKRRIKIDPMIIIRKSLSINDKVYFNDRMHSEILKNPLPAYFYLLTIPDSLAKKYELAQDNPDYEHDYAIIHQFSPLLPTIEPNVYLMEDYIWFNLCEGDGCVRMLSREFIKFRIKDQEIIYQFNVPLNNQNDFIGFGSFSKEKMENALPGEKITKFGW